MELAFVVYFIEVMTTSGAGPFFLGLILAGIYAALRIYRHNMNGNGGNRNRVLTSDCRFGNTGDVIVIKRVDADGEAWIENVTQGKKISEFHVHKAVYAVSTLEPVNGVLTIAKHTSRWWVVGALIVWSYGMLMPERDVAINMAAAAYAVQEVATNENVQTLAGNSFKVVDKFMGDYLNEKSENEAETAPEKTEAEPEQTPVEEQEAAEKPAQEATEALTIQPVNMEELNKNVQDVGKLATDMAETYKNVESILNQ